MTARSGALADFWRGYLALLPLWSGAIPAGVAFGVAARSAGLGFGYDAIQESGAFFFRPVINFIHAAFSRFVK